MYWISSRVIAPRIIINISTCVTIPSWEKGVSKKLTFLNVGKIDTVYRRKDLSIPLEESWANLAFELVCSNFFYDEWQRFYKRLEKVIFLDAPFRLEAVDIYLINTETLAVKCQRVFKHSNCRFITIYSFDEVHLLTWVIEDIIWGIRVTSYMIKEESSQNISSRNISLFILFFI